MTDVCIAAAFLQEPVAFSSNVHPVEISLTKEAMDDEITDSADMD